ncbi:polysaccharide lyase 8 family protein [Specibacter cremeus]|uniref:polysaccharide lyase 8 family protein n=1 Tax=Specibacter cremeus TaxID=1629051 RepID=UPI000F774DEF|nr:polysaccharide lyase 8 family protein [Specibacter cremeus]
MTHELSRRHILQGTAALTFAGLLSAGFTPMAQAAEAATTGDLDALRERWVDQITGRLLIDPADPDFTAAIAGVDRAVANSVSLLAPRPGRLGVFTDAPFSADAQIVTSYKRLAQMAAAWATPGSRYQGSEVLLGQVLGALEDGNTYIYNDGQAEYGNWWSWEIGTSKALTDTLAILGGNVGDELRAKYCAAIDHFIPDPTKQFSDARGKILSEGANRVDICQAIIVRSIVGGDTARLAAAITALSPVWQYVTSGNGFYSDGSFVQHTTIPYTGTYGVVLLGGLAKLFSLLGGSDHAVSDPSRTILFNTVEDSFAPFLHDGLMMDSVRGRAISRTQERGFDDGTITIEAILWLARAVDATTGNRWRALCKGWVARNKYSNPLDGASIPRTALLKELAASSPRAAAERQGHSFFPGMDRSVYRGKAWAAALGLSSRRTTWYECGNGENNLGAQTGSGMTYLYTGDQGHFDNDFWPTANLSRLPGITVDTTPLPPKVEGEWGAKTPQNEWTGGVTLDDSGAVGMHLIGPGGTGLQARKAWFYTKDMVVALGAGIHTASGAAVESIVEHRNLGADGGQAITVDGRRHNAAAGTQVRYRNPLWAHLEGTGGYLLLEKGDLTVLREQRTGSWKNINTGGTSNAISRQFATMLFEHGTAPVNASYAYALLPGASAKDTAKAARQDAPRVLRNDAVGQGLELDGKTTAALFWAPGTIGTLSADRPACVLFTGNPGQGVLAVSDPTQAADSVTITLTGARYRRITSTAAATLSQDEAGNTAVTIPTAGLLGRTVEVGLHR